MLLADLNVASAVCLSISIHAALSVPYYLLVESESARDFDPRPAVRRTAAVLHQGAVHAGHDLNRAYATSQRAAQDALREAALTVAALLILTIPTGGHR
ncbi:hypothetical protein [Streptomyces viridochromogenes]|uniref:hypothetical protein n=1 Tax=Streptomyces viridochromogenes TaxID=1938 RepID=UPI00069CE715|nr:hypothetical protein [Streptomyces viridochromogenes]KOG21760.1 hypothetical protein ADK36_12300 [Streptomyces viridochromogenes]